MKLKIPLLMALVITTLTSSSAQTVPRNDFLLSLSQTSISLAKGDSATVLVSITRSKLFKKGNAVFGFSSPDKKGIMATLETDSPDSCILKISTTNSAEPGAYMLVPNCTVQGKTIGSVLKVTINP
jgi:hypothetical protein